MTSSEPINPYDESPYPHLTHKLTSPERIETLATMFGLKPAPAFQCRVLELGCASGFNLFPMAYSYPNSHFTGIDYSKVEIDDGLKRVKELGLKNVELLTLDVMDIGSDFGKFDYIIAHGLYSWVPEFVRDQVMSVCKQHLTPQGIAYISYNAYPGCAIIGMLRGMMLYRSRDIESPVEKAQEAKKLIKFLAEAVAPDQSPYGAYLSSYLDITKKRRIGTNVEDGRLLLHDELADINDPVYFYEFVDHAASHGLQYLVEAEFSNVMPSKFPPEVGKHLRQISRDIIDMEQYLDFLNFRTFRSTLICHQEIEVNRNLRPQTIFDLFVQSQAKEVLDKPDDISENMFQFSGQDGARFTSDHPLTIAAIKYLSSIFPRAASFPELVRKCLKEVSLPEGESIDQHAALLAANLVRAYGYSESLVEFHLHPAEIVTEISEKPEASMLARWQLDYMYRVTNMRHERVEMDDFSRCLLRYLDGNHTRKEMLALLEVDLKEGRFELESSDESEEGTENDSERLANEMDDHLRFFVRAALLIA